MIAECANLLFQFPEGAFDPEPVTIKPDDRQRIQCQAGACQDALDAIHFHQYKTQFLIKLLPPQQVNAVVTDGFLLPIKLNLCILELFLMGDE